MLTRRHILAGGAALALPTTGMATMIEAPHFVPAEEDPHALTFMQWPNNRKAYREAWFLADVQRTILNIANTIAAFEPVILLADAAFHGQLKPRLASGVTLWDVPTDDLWARDSGPLFGRSEFGDMSVRGIRFNGWGEKQVHANDARVARRVADRLTLPYLPSGLTGEPGGVEQDGNGLLMAHASCWVNDNRNPGMSQQEVANALLTAYGAERIVWAPGLKGLDITDYHIDGLARFTGPNRALIQLPDTPDPNEPFHRAALETYDSLKQAGISLSVIPDPVSHRVQDPEFAGAYVNYYVCNGAVIAPEYGDAQADAAAAEALAEAYPGREIVALNADDLGWIGGGIHCATQQMPDV